MLERKGQMLLQILPLVHTISAGPLGATEAMTNANSPLMSLLFGIVHQRQDRREP